MWLKASYPCRLRFRSTSLTYDSFLFPPTADSAILKTRVHATRGRRIFCFYSHNALLGRKNHCCLGCPKGKRPALPMIPVLVRLCDLFCKIANDCHDGQRKKRKEGKRRGKRGYLEAAFAFCAKSGRLCALWPLRSSLGAHPFFPAGLRGGRPASPTLSHASVLVA